MTKRTFFLFNLLCGIAVFVVVVIIFTYSTNYVPDLMFRSVFSRMKIDRGGKKMPKIFENGYLDGESCERAIFDPSYASKVAKDRITLLTDADNGTVNCDLIRERGYYPTEPLSTEEANFSIAFARVAYRDYIFQELLLNLIYAPQNHYCYAIDKKATKEFHSKMRNLASCFPNVHISHYEYDVDSAGHNVVRSFLRCLEILLNYPNWRYVILLQNHDLPLKTNSEMVKILTALNGTNDVEMVYPNPERIPQDSWTFKDIHIFKDNAKNDDRQFHFAKGAVQGTFTRDFVVFLLRTVNVFVVLDRLEKMPFGIDEIFFASFNMEDNLGAPGGFTRRCMSGETKFITRMSIWYDMKKCGSKYQRKAICIFGIEDLGLLDRSKYLIANKMLPEFDYSAISCWAQRLFNLTHGIRTREPPDEKFYSQLPPVRFNRDRERWLQATIPFDCSINSTGWNVY